MKKLPLLWNEKLLGWIVSPKIDNYELYGKWEPVDSGLSLEFLQLLKTNGEANVVVGTEPNLINGIVEIEPEEEIDIKIIAMR